MGSDIITDYGLNIICLMGISISLAVSLQLINGYTGQFSLGHAGFMAVGGYVAAFITKSTLTGANPPDQSLLGTLPVYIFALCAGALAAAIAGLIVGIPSLRLKGDYLAIVTLGFGEIIRLVIENIEAVGGPRGYIGIPKFPKWTWLSAGGFEGTFSSLSWIFLFIIITIIVVHNIVESSFGRSLVAIRDNEIAAEAMGIDTSFYKVLAFTISAALAGFAGGLYAHLYGQLVPNTFNFVRSVEIIIMIVFGGMGSITGAVLGAIILTGLPEWLRIMAGLRSDSLPSWINKSLGYLPDLRMIIYSSLLILIMLVRPQGILGNYEFSLSKLLGKSSKNLPKTTEEKKA
ncbi:MAG: branched-chain amino acid ABC transporter permease [Acidobacteria bacterium]|nr:branched-chain amino acid ABC transporter permease [Acidobacteriota bacterium]